MEVYKNSIILTIKYKGRERGLTKFGAKKWYHIVSKIIESNNKMVFILLKIDIKIYIINRTLFLLK